MGAPFTIEFFNIHSDSKICNNVLQSTISLIKITPYPGTQVRFFGNRLIMQGGTGREAMEIVTSRSEIYGNYIENVQSRDGIRIDWGADDVEVHHNVIRGGVGSAIYIQPGDNSAGDAAGSTNINVYAKTIDGVSTGIKLDQHPTWVSSINNVNIKNNLIMNASRAVSVNRPASVLALSNVVVQ